MHFITVSLQLSLPFSSVLCELPVHKPFGQWLSSYFTLSWCQTTLHQVFRSGFPCMILEHSSFDHFCAPRNSFLPSSHSLVRCTIFSLSAFVQCATLPAAVSIVFGIVTHFPQFCLRHSPPFFFLEFKFWPFCLRPPSNQLLLSFFSSRGNFQLSPFLYPRADRVMVPRIPLCNIVEDVRIIVPPSGRNNVTKLRFPFLLPVYNLSVCKGRFFCPHLHHVKCVAPQLNSFMIPYHTGGFGTSHDSPRAQTCTFQGSGASNNTKIPRENPQESEEREKIVAGEGRETPPKGEPTLRGSLSRTPPLPFPLLHPTQPPAKSKNCPNGAAKYMAKLGFGQSW